jgi:DNA-binding transcriptional LysR family regulator
MNFRQLDLNLLRVLVAINRSGSVTAAGQALALSQPATSNALARLRSAFGDPLFVRSPRGLKPTALCQRIAAPLEAQLLELEQLLVNKQSFDPRSSPIHWRLSLSDLGEMLFLPPLAAALRQQAPNAQLSNVSVAASAVEGALEGRDIDLAIGILNTQRRSLRSQLLFKERYMLLSSRHWRPQGQVAGRTLGRTQLAKAQFIVAAPTATFHNGIETLLQDLKLQDRVQWRARHFAALPDMTAGTDLLSIVPQMQARALADRADLQLWHLARSPSYEVRLLWHGSQDEDPAHVWMRQLLARLFARPAREPAREKASS